MFTVVEPPSNPTASKASRAYLPSCASMLAVPASDPGRRVEDASWKLTGDAGASTDARVLFKSSFQTTLSNIAPDQDRVSMLAVKSYSHPTSSSLPPPGLKPKG